MNKYLISFWLLVSFNVLAEDPTDPPTATATPKPEESMFSNLSNRAWAYMEDWGLVESDEVIPITDEDLENERRAALAEMEHSNRNLTNMNSIQGQEQCNALSLNRLGSSVDTHNDAVVGIRLALATMYQSCEAPNITVPDSLRSRNSPVSGRPRSLMTRSRVAAYKSFNPYLANRSTVRNGCFNVLAQPPIYGFGAKPGINRGEIQLHRDQSKSPLCGKDNGKSGVSCTSQPASAIDCSGLVTGAFRRMGLNMKPNEKFVPGLINTTALNNKTAESGSCMEFAKASPTISIVPGDILNKGSNHVVMIDEVGADPLGIKKHVRNNTCRNLKVSDFDFKFIHSGAVGSLGAARLDARHPDILNFMENLAIRAMVACNSIKNGARDVVLGGGSGSAFSIIRHKGDSVPGCKGEPEVFDNEECVSQCGIM